ncbi:MAG TPA: MerR family transcriptional regulator [Gemmatimonadales bacterium]|jgi:DNA-binding transcriptional MerR regulator
MSEPATYDLNELSDLAGVTPRTVRYYIQQGLLRSPGSSGPGVKYGEGHLLRLRLIRRLQQEHFPLSEIRRRLRSLGDEKVREALQTTPVRSPVVEYVRQVLAEKAEAPPRVAPSFAVGALRAITLGKAAPSAAEPAPLAERSQWDRMTLSPDIELHVRRPLSRLQNKIVEKLLDYARRLLEEETP